jgi:anaerobic magnesium-protoporphyrin IX monomethyl ester cyclase
MNTPVVLPEFNDSMVREPASRQTRVLLIYPPVRLSASPRYPPYGFLYLGAVLREAGIDVEVMDINLLRLPFDEVMQRLDEMKFDVIGIGGMTTVYYYMKLLSLELKSRYPDVPIIGGGSACSASPEVVLRNTGFDVVCIGEGEPIISDLVRRLADNESIADIPGIAYLGHDGEPVLSSERARMPDMLSLPYPAYDLVDMDTYLRNNSAVYTRVPGVQERVEELGIDPDRVVRPMTLFTKRGCPFGCNFCYRNFGRKVAHSSVDYTLDHMSFLEERFNTQHFIFNDEIFNVDKHWVMEFCQRLIDEDRRYILGANNGFRANVLDRDMVMALKEAGFCQIGIGIESFYDPTLKAMQKGQTAAQVFNAIRLTKEAGLHINSAQLLFGYETDGEESMKANVEALTELGFTWANYSIPCPYPGTYLYGIAREAGHIEDEEHWLMELADRDISDRVINLSNMSEAELRGWIRWGDDQLKINHLRPSHPIVAGVLDHLQPIIRRMFEWDLYNGIERVWAALRGLQVASTDENSEHVIADIFGPDIGNGPGFTNDTPLRYEALERLEKWDVVEKPQQRRYRVGETAEKQTT